MYICIIESLNYVVSYQLIKNNSLKAYLTLDWLPVPYKLNNY